MLAIATRHSMAITQHHNTYGIRVIVWRKGYRSCAGNTIQNGRKNGCSDPLRGVIRWVGSDVIQSGQAHVQKSQTPVLLAIRKLSQPGSFDWDLCRGWRDTALWGARCGFTATSIIGDLCALWRLQKSSGISMTIRRFIPFKTEQTGTLPYKKFFEF